VRSVSIGMTIILYLFQLSITFTLDRGKDWVDIVLRATLVMEFIYALLQSLVLFGSYAFFVYHLMVKKMVYGGLPSRFPKVVRALDYVFSWCGYTTTWGTK